MTWSIVARDHRTGAFGVAVASKFVAVGALCPHGDGSIGALSTQALPNPLWGTRGLRLLREGMPAPHVVEVLTRSDKGADQRQLHLIDGRGEIAAHTGTRCIGWCGHLIRDRFSVAGNMLAGPAVIADTAATFEQSHELPFVRRLIKAMEAGEAAGGDKRGRQSAALITWTTEEYAAVNLRVDDHDDPLGELSRLAAVSRQRLAHYVKFMPTRANPCGTLDRAVIEAGIAEAVAAGREE